MPKNDIDYLKTIIYKIVCKDLNITDFYVGHTTNFIKRKATHKTACNNINNKKELFTHCICHRLLNSDLNLAK